MKRTAVIIAITLCLAACATFSRNYKLGVNAEMSRDYESAVSYFQKASAADPKNTAYRVAFTRARASASVQFLTRARIFSAQHKKEDASAAYKKALYYDPGNRMIMEELRALENPKPAPSPSDAGTVPIQGPLSLRSGHEKLNLVFRTEVSVKSMLQAIGRMSGINFLFDEQFRDGALAVDLSGKEVEQAVRFICAASKNFYRIIDDKTILVAPDNIQKRQQYELNALKTFYLSNINVQDVQQQLTAIMRSAYKAPNIQVDKTLNSLTVRDTPQVVEMIGRLLRKWDKPRGEVLIDVEIMEISRIKAEQLGLDLSDTSLKFRFLPSLTDSDDYFSIKGIDLGDLNNYQMSVPYAALQFLGTDTDTKIIAQPRFRGISGEEIRYMVGQKVPVINTSYRPSAAGGTESEPIVSYTQQDVGIEIKLKPRIHLEGEVTLEMDFKITSITGYGVANAPILSTREVKNIIRLKDGETNLLAGLLKDEERKSLAGIPGLKDLPLLGRLFSNNTKAVEKTDVVLTVTPRIIRNIDIGEEDLKPLWIEPDSLSGISGNGGEAKPEEAPAPAVEESREPAPAEPQPARDMVYISPAALEIPADREFTLNVELESQEAIANMSMVVLFDPQVLQLKEVKAGGLVTGLGQNTPFLSSISGSSCTLGFSSPKSDGFKGPGTMAVLSFKPVGKGETVIGIQGVSAVGSGSRAVRLEAGKARVLVR